MAAKATCVLVLSFQLCAVALPYQALPVRPAAPSAAYGTSAPEQTAAWIAATSGYMGTIGTNLGLLAHGRWYPFMANIQNLVWPPLVGGMIEARKANPLVNKKILKGATDTVNSGKKNSEDSGDSTASSSPDDSDASADRVSMAAQQAQQQMGTSSMTQATSVGNIAGANTSSISSAPMMTAPNNVSSATQSPPQALSYGDKLEWIGHPGADDGSSSASPTAWSLKSHLMQLNKQVASNSN